MDDAFTELLARAETRLGSTLRGKYQLDAILGLGGMAVVYRGTNVSVGRRCAVKMLHAELSVVPSIRERFLREGRAANAVRSAGIVDVLDTDVAEDGAAFLVMELLEGESVEALAEKSGGRLSPRRALAIGYHVAGVLAAAHACGIIHRDIKPANLFVTKDGRLKVLDFGIARLSGAGGTGAGTAVGTAIGTPGYMAPEQAQGDAISPLTDVWAMGATLFKLISGEYAHEATSEQALVISAATRPARSLGSILGSSEATPVVAVVDRALAYDKAARWQSATELKDAIRATFLAAFGAAVEDEPLVTTTEAPPTLPAPTAPVDPTGSEPTMQAPSAEVSGAVPYLTSSTASSTPVTRTAGERRPGTGRAVAVVALLAALVGVVVAVVVVHGRSSSPPPPTTASSPVVESATSTTSTTSTSSEEATAASTVADVPIAATATHDAGAAAVTAKPTSAHPSAKASAKASASASAAPPNCTPNYVLQADGTKRFKPECFN